MLRGEFNVDIPALLVTGDTAPDRLRDAEASGLPILHKPLNPARLRTLIANLLREGTAQPERRRARASPAVPHGGADRIMLHRSISYHPGDISRSLYSPSLAPHEGASPLDAVLNATDRYLASRLLSSSRGLPVGLPGPHRRPRIHPADRAGPLHRCVHGEPALQRVSRHPRPGVRPALRARLPARPGRGEARRDLPPEARRRRSSRRCHRPSAEDSASSRTASASPASAPVAPRSRSPTT